MYGNPAFFWTLEAAEEAASSDSEEKPLCVHHRVYAVTNEGPYPWICSSCLVTGEDPQYPVCNSQLFAELQAKISGVAGQAKLRSCYYCGKFVNGVFSEHEPVRCGKCF